MNGDLTNIIKHNNLPHYARQISFQSLHAGLTENVLNGYINVSYHPKYSHIQLYKYNRKCVFEKHWNDFTLIARGLIIDVENKKIIAVSFPKFFNYNEICDSDNFITINFVTTEKIDGSLGICFNVNKEWFVATAGSFISEQAQWATQWLYKNINIEKLNPEYTYLTEIVYPANRIVINYNIENLFLISIYDSKGYELSYYNIKNTAIENNFGLIKQFHFNFLHDIVALSATLPINREGFVIRFSNGVRLKIKGEEYCRIHKIISRVTPIAVWEVLLNQDNLDKLKQDLPEEFCHDFDEMKKILELQLEEFINEVKLLHQNTKNKTDKELGLFIDQHPESFEGMKYASYKFLFQYRKGRFEDDFNTIGSVGRRKIFDIIRPKNNILEGYQPSSAVNQFNNIDNF